MLRARFFCQRYVYPHAIQKAKGGPSSTNATTLFHRINKGAPLVMSVANKELIFVIYFLIK